MPIVKRPEKVTKPSIEWPCKSKQCEGIFSKKQFYCTTTIDNLLVTCFMMQTKTRQTYRSCTFAAVVRIRNKPSNQKLKCLLGPICNNGILWNMKVMDHNTVCLYLHSRIILTRAPTLFAHWKGSTKAKLCSLVNILWIHPQRRLVCCILDLDQLHELHTWNHKTWSLDF